MAEDTSVLLPLYPEPYYSYSIDLDNKAFQFTFRWNERAEQWMMSIADAEGDPVLYNIPLVPGYPLLEQFSLESPIGTMFLLSVNESEIYKPIPIPREIYKTHFLIYDNFGLDVGEE